MERVRIEAELPAALAEQARAFVAEGCASDLDELLAEALRRFLESRTSEFTETFMKEDIPWAFMETTETTSPSVVCAGGDGGEHGGVAGETRHDCSSDPMIAPPGVVLSLSGGSP